MKLLFFEVSLIQLINEFLIMTFPQWKQLEIKIFLVSFLTMEITNDRCLKQKSEKQR
jgi:hypothetical protein